MTEEDSENISYALTLLLTCDNSDLACSTLLKILTNIVNNPGEAKFRTLRLSNPKVQEAVVANPGGVELLSAIGFQLHFDHEKPSEG
jgi:UBX domain-containing protein 6